MIPDVKDSPYFKIGKIDCFNTILFGDVTDGITAPHDVYRIITTHRNRNMLNISFKVSGVLERDLSSIQ
jgi:hypothetical protein